MAAAPQSKEIQAKDIPPHTAIDAGYNLYLADNCEESALKHSAIKTVADFLEICDLFEPKTKRRS